MEDHMLFVTTPPPSPELCAQHPAYEADYCPVCGTAQVIGDAR